MSYVWIEKDSGDTITLSDTLTTSIKNSSGTTTTVSVGFSVTSTNKSETLHNRVVEYCDSTTGDGYEYGGSGSYIKFNVRQ